MTKTTRVLVSQKRHMGKIVALRSFSDNTVVASGKDYADVLARARRAGVESPVMVRVPAKKMIRCCWSLDRGREGLPALPSCSQAAAVAG